MTTILDLLVGSTGSTADDLLVALAAAPGVDRGSIRVVSTPRPRTKGVHAVSWTQDGRSMAREGSTLDIALRRAVRAAGPVSSNPSAEDTPENPPVWHAACDPADLQGLHRLLASRRIGARTRQILEYLDGRDGLWTGTLAGLARTVDPDDPSPARKAIHRMARAELLAVTHTENETTVRLTAAGRVVLAYRTPWAQA